MIETPPERKVQWITEECAASFRRHVEESDGNEVFAIGTCNAESIIVELDVLAFGTNNAVPAPAQNAVSGQVLLHNHPSGELQPSAPDISIASLYGKSGIGFYITDNTCTNVRVVVKPFFEKPAVPIEFQDLMELFGPEGRLAREMSGFEHRPQQLQMMQSMVEAFNRGMIPMIEAGTGTGKSFAYLAPAILWSTANKKRIVISTNTINLQEQILKKDLPELAARLDLEFNAVLIKGRSNYISIRRLKLAGMDPGLFDGTLTGQVGLIRQWADSTQDGSKSDLAFEVSPDVWEQVMSDKDDCLRARCPHFNECFFYKSRRQAAAADILVANHHLVMADLALNAEITGNDYVSILPPYERIIFDEAHHIEEIATAYFGSEISPYAIRRQMGRLFISRERGGILPRFVKALLVLKPSRYQSVTDECLGWIENKLLPVHADVSYVVDSQFQDLAVQAGEFFETTLMKLGERREFRITRSVISSDFWRDIVNGLESIIRDLNRLLKPMDVLLEMVKEFGEEQLADLSDYRSQVQSSFKKLSEYSDTLKFFLAAADSEHCRWIEISQAKSRQFVRLCTAPLDVTPALQETLFLRKRTVALTSATLTVDGKFDYMAKQLGLPANPEPNSLPEPVVTDLAARLMTIHLDTPFDYASNCLVGIPTDLPTPADPTFDKAITEPIGRTLTISQGRAFVLFTSYRALMNVLQNCRAFLERHGLRALRQGEVPRHKLLQLFKDTDRGVLFATSSFWEGVDVQGRALECLILTRLPFSVPSTPIIEARAERIESMGGSAFYQLTVPHAVIKFKQGFGRLIRSRSDRGIVLILDNRVLNKPYGKIFLRSLPPARRVAAPFSEVAAEFQRFFE